MTQKIQEIINKRAEYDKLVKSLQKEDLTKYFFKYFEEFGDELVAIDLAMSTPTYNDGDPCTNSIHEPKIYTKTNILHLLKETEETSEEELPKTDEQFLAVADEHKDSYDELDYGSWEKSKRTPQQNRLREISSDCFSLQTILEDKFGTDVGFFITKNDVKQREVYNRG